MTTPAVQRLADAAMAGGPVEDFTGPNNTQMPFFLWSVTLRCLPDRRLPFADRLVIVVEAYRKKTPAYWEIYWQTHGGDGRG